MKFKSRKFQKGDLVSVTCYDLTGLKPFQKRVAIVTEIEVKRHGAADWVKVWVPGHNEAFYTLSELTDLLRQG